MRMVQVEVKEIKTWYVKILIQDAERDLASIEEAASSIVFDDNIDPDDVEVEAFGGPSDIVGEPVDSFGGPMPDFDYYYDGDALFTQEDTQLPQ